MRAVLVLAALLAACKNETPEAAELRWRSALEKELTAASHRGPGAALEPEPVAAAVTTPGPAYLAMSEGGIVKIDSGAVTVLESPPDIQMLTTSPTGELYALTAESVYKLVDATFERLGAEKITKQYGARIAVAPAGRLWLADGDTARYWTGSEWKETGKAFPDDEQYARSIAIDGKGRVYLSSKVMIVVHDQDTWKPVFDLRGVYIDGNYPSPTFMELVIAPSGELYAVNGNGILKFDGTTVTPQLRPLKKAGLTGLAAIDGTTLVTMSEHQIVRWPVPNGEDVVTTATREIPLGESAVLDGTGRVWMAVKTGGFSVVDRSGMGTHFPPGSVAELTSAVRAVAVAGGGPELPMRAEIARGSIKGVIAKAGVPLPGVSIEVCQRLASQFTGTNTPCSNKKTMKAKTDENGAFAVKDLPLLDYGVAALVDGNWYGIRGKACKGLTAGAECDLGMLDVATNDALRE